MMYKPIKYYSAVPAHGDWPRCYFSSKTRRRKLGRLLKLQCGKCKLCKKLFGENDVMEIDHIIPKSKGGSNQMSNLQLLHAHCHDLKHGRKVRAHTRHSN